MANAHHRLFDGFFIKNHAVSNIHRDTKPLRNEIFDNVDLHFSHQSQVDFSKRFLPYHMKSRVFLLQEPKLRQKAGGVDILRQNNAVIQHGLQQRRDTVCSSTQTHPRGRFRKSQGCANSTGINFVSGTVFFSGIEPQLADFFRDLLPGMGRKVRYRHAHL